MIALTEHCGRSSTENTTGSVKWCISESEEKHKHFSNVTPPKAKQLRNFQESLLHYCRGSENISKTYQYIFTIDIVVISSYAKTSNALTLPCIWKNFVNKCRCFLFWCFFSFVFFFSCEDKGWKGSSVPLACRTRWLHGVDLLTRPCKPRSHVTAGTVG